MGKRQITASHSGKHKFNCFFSGERWRGAGTEIKQIPNQLCQGPRAELTVRSNALGAMGSAHGGGRRQVVETGPWKHGVAFLSFLPLACQGSTGFLFDGSSIPRGSASFASAYPASACMTCADVPWAKANHMAQPSINVGGASARARTQGKGAHGVVPGEGRGRGTCLSGQFWASGTLYHRPGGKADCQGSHRDH